MRNYQGKEAKKGRNDGKAKAEAIAAKRRRARRGISLSSEKEDKSDTRDNTDPDQANLDQAKDKYLVELWKEMR